MTLLDDKLNKFVDLDQSAEYVKAKKLVLQHGKLLDELKTIYKEKGIHAHMTRDGDLVKRLKFKVTKFERFQMTLIPEEIKAEYMREIEVWYSQVDKYTLGNGELGE